MHPKLLFALQTNEIKGNLIAILSLEEGKSIRQFNEQIVIFLLIFEIKSKIGYFRQSTHRRGTQEFF